MSVVTHAHAQIVLTFEETIARARDQSGQVAVARALIAEAEAGVVVGEVSLPPFVSRTFKFWLRGLATI